MFRRTFHTTATAMGSSVTARTVFQTSCYHKIDFRISDTCTARDAINQFTAFNVGCLAVVNSENKIVGVCSERDYIKKVASLDLNAEEVKVKDICTPGSQIIFARSNDSLESCMNKMLVKDIRHLILMEGDQCIGMISVKDLTKQIMKDNNETIARLCDFGLGKGAFFGSE